MEINEINCETGETIIREMNNEEFANYKRIQAHIPEQNESETL